MLEALPMEKKKNCTAETITLEIGGPRITPSKFRRSINAFFDIINEVVKSYSGDSRDANWVVSVSPGSASIHLTAESGSPRLPGRNVPKLLGAIQGGLKTIETSSERPPFFCEDALKKVKALASILDGEINSIKILWNEQSVRITEQTTANLALIFNVAYKSWGSVDGEVSVVSKKRGLECSVYDDVIDRYIPCHFKSNLLPEVLQSFGKRVSASGIISYRSDNEIESISVEELEVFPDSETLPHFEDLFGLFRGVE